MSILGVIVRTRLEDLPEVEQALRALPGTELAQREGAPDGRLVLVIEDRPGRAASAVMGDIATWPKVLNTSLVYEHADPDAPSEAAPLQGYTDWRGSLGGPAASDPGDDPQKP